MREEEARGRPPPPVTWEWFKQELRQLTSMMPADPMSSSLHLRNFSCEQQCWKGREGEGEPRPVGWVVERVVDLLVETHRPNQVSDRQKILAVYDALPAAVRAVVPPTPVPDMRWQEFVKFVTSPHVAQVFTQQMLAARPRKGEDQHPGARRVAHFNNVEAEANPTTAATAPPQSTTQTAPVFLAATQPQYMTAPPQPPAPVAPAAPQQLTATPLGFSEILQRVAMATGGQLQGGGRGPPGDRRHEPRDDYRGREERRDRDDRRGGDDRGRGDERRERDDYRGREDNRRDTHRGRDDYRGRGHARGTGGPPGGAGRIPSHLPFPRPTLEAGEQHLPRPPPDSRPGQWWFWADTLTPMDLGRAGRERCCAHCKGPHHVSLCDRLNAQDYPQRFFFYRNPRWTP